MILRIIDRINKIREIEDLNKSQFERKINKSTGYINMLEKKKKDRIIKKFKML